MILLVLSIGLFILLAGFFSGSETAFMRLDPLILDGQLKDSKKGHVVIRSLERLSSFSSRTQKFLIAFLIGTNFSLVSATVLFTYVLETTGHAAWQYDMAFAAILLVFSEIVPKVLYRKNAFTFAVFLSGFWKSAYIVFYPFMSVINLFVRMFMRGLRIEDEQESLMTREELQNFFDEPLTNGLLHQKEQRIIGSVLDFGETYAKEIMTPLNEVVAIEKSNKISQLLELFEQTNLSKIPVYDSRIYTMIGSINVNDLFEAKQNNKITHFMKPAFYAPETKKIDDLFFEMTDKKQKICFLVDEYGAVSGIVTLRDIAEEIVGDIKDLDEPHAPLLKKTGEREYEADAVIDMDDLNDQLGMELPKKDYETLAGFLLYHLGHIPVKGEELIYENLKFVILKADLTSISTVRIKQVQPDFS